MTAGRFTVGQLPAAYAIRSTRTEPADSLDDFPTPPWATRALCEHALNIEAMRDSGRGPIWRRVWEPACNRGYMAKALREYFPRVLTSDVHDYGFGQDATTDFLSTPADRFDPTDAFDWIITNPPFRLSVDFWLKAVAEARVGVAMLVRLQWLETVGRYNRVFNTANRPNAVWIFVERLPMVRGRYDPDIGTASSYCWLVWRRDWPHSVSPALCWIPPGTRNRLERRSDVLI